MTESFPDGITIGEKYGPAMEVTDEAEARAYFERCVANTMRLRPEIDRAEAETIERSNLGYYAGYYSDDVRARVERLYGAVHPIFGSVATGGPTAEEAFEMGKRWAEGEKS